MRCFFGSHKWAPVKGTEYTDGDSIYSLHRYAEGICERCGKENTIRKAI